MPPIIEIHKLGKRYSIRDVQPYLTLRDVVTERAKSILKKSKRHSNEFWALQNINLEIEKGERIGIIGRNGAGKSTLLKILSRITPPTTGKIKLRGRVASLLEVGTGFHPELTGRENIYLNGSILGLSKKEINRKLDEIIDFSGVEKFIDTPLKHYSSGMQLRLAFSVAAHLEPEILLIDEVLAVGDLEFQKKCIGKMEEISKSDGRTIVFVSHDLGSISTLTEKTVLLHEGIIRQFDTPANVIAAYTKSGMLSEKYFSDEKDNNQPHIRQIELITSENNDLQAHGQPMSIVFEVYIPNSDMQNMALAFQVMHREIDRPVLHQWLFDAQTGVVRKKGINRLKFTFPAVNLYKGNYYLKVHLAESKYKVKFDEVECCFFRVEMLNLPAPEWGWYDNMALYLEKGKWEEIS
jgi:lipopolysaccharide transport system ATP-binding protein